MKKVLKYTISSKDCNINTVGKGGIFTFKMIKNAEILNVQTQFTNESDGYGIQPMGLGRIWVLVDETETETEERNFILVETGDSFDIDNKKYIGTYQVFGGKIVLHLFECFYVKN